MPIFSMSIKIFTLQQNNYMNKILSLTMLLVFAASSIFAQHKAPENRKSPHETVKGNNVSVTYGRPYKNGREIFGGLVPYGQVWRAGADEATEITLVKASSFAGKQLGAGTYTLFVIPNKDSWTIILNRKLGQWGAFDYDKVKDGDIIHADVPVKSATSPVEQFTIDVNNGGFNMSWDKTSVFVPVKPY